MTRIAGFCRKYSEASADPISSWYRRYMAAYPLARNVTRLNAAVSTFILLVVLKKADKMRPIWIAQR